LIRCSLLTSTLVGFLEPLTIKSSPACSSESSIRGAVYQARKANGETGPRRVRETTTEGAVASALETLEQAREAIDDEVEAAKERADEATREYKALKDSAADRKAEITTKIEALSA
jgi:molecular chaperone DnaK (HSP70)